MRARLTYANVMATIAVFLALGGGAYAALKLPKNSVRARQLAPNSVRASEIARNAVRAQEVRDGSLLASDFKTGQLPAGPAGPPGRDGVNGAANVVYRRTTVEDVASTTPATPASASATCQAGERLIGGGAGWKRGNLTPYEADGVLSVNGPGKVTPPATLEEPIATGETPPEWFASGINTTGNPADLVVYAICALP